MAVPYVTDCGGRFSLNTSEHSIMSVPVAYHCMHVPYMHKLVATLCLAAILEGNCCHFNLSEIQAQNACPCVSQRNKALPSDMTSYAIKVYWYAASNMNKKQRLAKLHVQAQYFRSEHETLFNK